MKYICIASTFVTFLFSQIDYDSQIQPIFNTNCVSCHTPGGSATFDLTSYNGLMSGGWTGPAIIAGDHANSLLYQRLTLPQYTAGSMPPNVPLSQTQINLIVQWIDEGAANFLFTDDIFIPKEHILHQNYPNPFNPSTNISFTLNKEEFVSIDIYNINGTHVISLFNGIKNIGTHAFNWGGRDKNGDLISTGQYFYQLRTKSSSLIMKMLFIK